MCDCSSNYPEFFRSQTIISRKAHRCCECHFLMPPGSCCEKISGKWVMSDVAESFYTCPDCVEIREYVLENIRDRNCYSFGDLFDQDCYDEPLFWDEEELLENVSEDFSGDWLFETVPITTKVPWLKIRQGHFALNKVADQATCGTNSH